MGNKTRLITPFFMLLAGAIASIIMYVRHFELLTSLKILLLVLVIFYILGDILRYIYAAIRPRIIPDMTLDDVGREFTFENVEIKEGEDESDEEVAEDEESAAQTDEPEQPEEDDEPQMADASEEEGYADEDLVGNDS